MYSGIAFLPDGRLVAVDNTNMKCLVYNYNLRVLKSQKLSFEPLGVVSVSANEVAVTTGEAQTINFLKIKRNNKITEDLYIAVSQNVDYFST